LDARSRGPVTYSWPPLRDNAPAALLGIFTLFPRLARAARNARSRWTIKTGM
jgi:hypothetical protein